MRGYVEESPEKKALDVLCRAAKKYAATYLLDMFNAEDERTQLALAAEDYGKIVNPPPKPRVRKKKT